MKSQERNHRTAEVLNVLRLRSLSAFGIGLFPLGKSLCGSFCFEVSTNLFDYGSWCPNPTREDFAALLFSNNPMLAGSFDSASKSRITGRHENPASRHC